MVYSRIKSYKIPGTLASRLDKAESIGWEDWDDLGLADQYRRLEKMKTNGNTIGVHRANFLTILKTIESDMQELENYRNGVAGNRRREAIAATKAKKGCAGDGCAGCPACDDCHFGD